MNRGYVSCASRITPEKGGVYATWVLGRLSNLVLEECLYQEMKGGQGNPRQREQHKQELGGIETQYWVWRGR